MLCILEVRLQGAAPCFKFPSIFFYLFNGDFDILLVLDTSLPSISIFHACYIKNIFLCIFYKACKVWLFCLDKLF